MYSYIYIYITSISRLICLQLQYVGVKFQMESKVKNLKDLAKYRLNINLENVSKGTRMPPILFNANVTFKRSKNCSTLCISLIYIYTKNRATCSYYNIPTIHMFLEIFVSCFSYIKKRCTFFHQQILEPFKELAFIHI